MREPSVLLSDAVDEYLDLRRAKNSSSTLTNDASVLRRFLAHTGNIRCKSMTPKHVESFFYGSDGLKTKLAPASFNQVIIRLRGFLRFADGRGWIKKDLLGNVDRQRETTRDRLRLSPAELLMLLDASDGPRDRAALAVGVNTALRADEITSLRVGDLDLDQSLLRVWISKSKIEDYMPVTSDLDAEMRTWLAFYQAECGPLKKDWYLVPTRSANATYFADRGRRDFKLIPDHKITDAADVVHRALREIGMDGVGEGFHTIRRSVARIYFDDLDARGYDGALLATSALLHHGSVAVTQRYLGLSMERQRRDVSLRGKPFLTRLVSGPNVVPLRGAVDL